MIRRKISGSTDQWGPSRISDFKVLGPIVTFPARSSYFRHDIYIYIILRSIDQVRDSHEDVRRIIYMVRYGP